MAEEKGSEGQSMREGQIEGLVSQTESARGEGGSMREGQIEGLMSESGDIGRIREKRERGEELTAEEELLLKSTPEGS